MLCSRNTVGNPSWTCSRRRGAGDDKPTYDDADFTAMYIHVTRLRALPSNPSLEMHTQRAS